MPSALRPPQLPWKSLASIVQFYYMWKTTDRYIQQVRPGREVGVWGGLLGGIVGRGRPPAETLSNPLCPPSLQKRLKAAEADSKLKQVYIPT